VAQLPKFVIHAGAFAMNVMAGVIGVGGTVIVTTGGATTGGATTTGGAGLPAPGVPFTLALEVMFEPGKVVLSVA
jgi:hypothetical protein